MKGIVVTDKKRKELSILLSEVYTRIHGKEITVTLKGDEHGEE